MFNMFHQTSITDDDFTLMLMVIHLIKSNHVWKRAFWFSQKGDLGERFSRKSLSLRDPGQHGKGGHFGCQTGQVCSSLLSEWMWTRKRRSRGSSWEGGEWQIIGWVHNMQFAHARVSEKVEKSCVEVRFEDMIGNPRHHKSETSDKQQKKRPWHIFKHQSIGKDYAGDQKMANPKKAQFNQIVTRKCQIWFYITCQFWDIEILDYFLPLSTKLNKVEFDIYWTKTKAFRAIAPSSVAFNFANNNQQRIHQSINIVDGNT